MSPFSLDDPWSATIKQMVRKELFNKKIVLFYFLQEKLLPVVATNIKATLWILP